MALVFEYINGFHDTANSIATVVSTKVLTPRDPKFRVPHHAPIVPQPNEAPGQRV